MTLLELVGDVQGGCVIVLVGTVGGSAFYFVKGALSSSSRGCRLAGGVREVVANARRVRHCAAWVGVLAVIAHRTSEGDCKAPEGMALAWGGANALFSAHKGAPDAICDGVKGAVYGAATGITISMLGRFLNSMESSRSTCCMLCF